jgi:hypothetical protein
VNYRLAEEGNLSRTQMLESKWIAKCMLNYISRHRYIAVWPPPYPET